MKFVRVVLCVFALAMTTAAFGTGDNSGEEGSLADEAQRAATLLSSKLAEKLEGYVSEKLLDDERFAHLVDREYWNSIKEKFTANIDKIIAEDEFIQSLLPIIANIRKEFRALVQLTWAEITKRAGSFDYSVFERLRSKSLEIIERGISRIKKLAEEKPEEYRAMLVKIGEAVGDTADTVAEETTLLVAVTSAALTGDALYNP